MIQTTVLVDPPKYTTSYPRQHGGGEGGGTIKNSMKLQIHHLHGISNRRRRRKKKQQSLPDTTATTALQEHPQGTPPKEEAKQAWLSYYTPSSSPYDDQVEPQCGGLFTNTTSTYCATTTPDHNIPTSGAATTTVVTLAPSQEEQGADDHRRGMQQDLSAFLESSSLPFCMSTANVSASAAAAAADEYFQTLQLPAHRRQPARPSSSSAHPRQPTSTTNTTSAGGAGLVKEYYKYAMEKHRRYQHPFYHHYRAAVRSDPDSRQHLPQRKDLPPQRQERRGGPPERALVRPSLRTQHNYTGPSLQPPPKPSSLKKKVSWSANTGPTTTRTTKKPLKVVGKTTMGSTSQNNKNNNRPPRKQPDDEAKAVWAFEIVYDEANRQRLKLRDYYDESNSNKKKDDGFDEGRRCSVWGSTRKKD